MEKAHIINSVKGGLAILEYIKEKDVHNISDMSRTLGISHITVRKAISLFLKENIIVQEKAPKVFSPARYKIVE